MKYRSARDTWVEAVVVKVYQVDIGNGFVVAGEIAYRVRVTENETIEKFKYPVEYELSSKSVFASGNGIERARKILCSK